MNNEGQPKQAADVAHSTHITASIAGKNVRFYFRASWFFILLALVLEVINTAIVDYEYSRWIIVAAISILYTLWLLKRLSVSRGAVITASVVWAVSAGLLVAIFDVIWYHQWWYLLNIVRLPFLYSVVGVAVSVLLSILIKSNPEKK